MPTPAPIGGGGVNLGGGLLPPASAFSENSAVNANYAVSNMEKLISNMIGAATTIAGLMFLIYFLMAAFNWISAGGEASKVQKARDQITNAAVGMVVLIAAYTLVGLVGSILGLRLLNPGQTILELNPLK